MPCVRTSESVATLRSQNMIVGSLSHISYAAFLVALAPIAAAGLALIFVLLAVVYRSEFLTAERFDGEATPRRYDRSAGRQASLSSLS